MRRLPKRKRVGSSLVTYVRFAHDDAGQKGTERKRDPEKLGRHVGNAEGNRQHSQREQLT